MTCLQLCVLLHFQICGTFPPVFVNISFRSTLPCAKTFSVLAFIQRSWRNRNWTIPSEFPMAFQEDGHFMEPHINRKLYPLLDFTKYCLPFSLTGFPYTSTRMHLFPCVPLRSKVTVEAFLGTIKVCVITWSTWFP